MHLWGGDKSAHLNNIYKQSLYFDNQWQILPIFGQKIAHLLQKKCFKRYQSHEEFIFWQLASKFAAFRRKISVSVQKNSEHLKISAERKFMF